jgi:hypothetical protein
LTIEGLNLYFRHMDSEPNETLGESMFPYKGRIPETGSWPATIFLWVMAILSVL